MLLNSGKLTAKEAKLRGFVTEVFPHDSLKRNTMTLIEECAKRSSEVRIAITLFRFSFAIVLEFCGCFRFFNVRQSDILGLHSIYCRFIRCERQFNHLVSDIA